jgi:serine/tyrosine/threonine adenylyltransferase
LKGAGLTPFSRSADGRKVLRSSLREFLCSEAMFYLGVPTTRAGTCIVSSTTVTRDMFYDGHPKKEKCAVILRLAQSFLRFGSFEIFLPMDQQTGGRGPSYGRKDILIQMLDYVCNELYSNKNDDKMIKYENVFEEIVKRTARLCADWQCNGFVHGVLNTDNMSIVGLTIDYGPFGFLDKYDPDHIFNHSDSGGRYTYSKQPSICEWNCVKLAEAIQTVLPITKTKTIIHQVFRKEFTAAYLTKMSLKFGLKQRKIDDEKMFNEFLGVMYETGADFTNSFRKLSQLTLSGKDKIDNDLENYLSIILNECCSVDELKTFYKPKFDGETLSKLLEALEVHPEIVSYLGISEATLLNQASFAQKYERIKVILN